MGLRILKKKRKLPTKVESSAILIKKLAIARKRLRRMEMRLIRAQSSIQSLEEEKSELLERNTKILESFQAQKLEIAARQRETLNWQKLYHDASVTVNSHEVKRKEFIQGVINSLKEIDKMFPNIVSLSESLASNKLRMKELLGLLATTGEDNLPRIAPEGLSPTTRRNLKPTKHRVGPMVRGMLITKPQIVLERLTLPQQQDQEQANNEEVGVNQLTPIQEHREVEEMALRNVSERANKRRLGRGKIWRMNKNKGIVSGPLERKKEKDRLAPDINYSSSDSEESDSGHASQARARGLMEPVVRIRDVSRLLQNSSLMKVDTEPNDNGMGSGDNADSNNPSRRVARNLPPANHDDPLEGSSWMFQNRHSYRSHKRSKPVSSSDSSDEENLADSLHHQGPSYHPNASFKVPGNSLFSSLKQKASEGLAENAVDEAEPDSTNNIEISMSDAPEDANSSSSSVNSLSRSYPDSKRQTFTISQFNENIVPTSASTPSNPAGNNSIISDSGENLVPTPQFDTSRLNVREKRVRKPKKNLYPGESDSEPDQGKQSKKMDKQKPKMTVERKPSLNKNRKSKSFLGRKSVLNQDRSDGSNTKKSTTKLSLITPRNSSVSDSLLDLPESTRSSRRKKDVIYKEPSLNKKMRKP